MSFSADELSRHVHYLTDNIGVRLAGSQAERDAADYLAAEFRKYSNNVKIFEYPVMERNVTGEKLEVAREMLKVVLQ